MCLAVQLVFQEGFSFGVGLLEAALDVVDL